MYLLARNSVGVHGVNFRKGHITEVSDDTYDKIKFAENIEFTVIDESGLTKVDTTPKEKEVKSLADMGWKELIKFAQVQGIKTHGKKREKIEDELSKLG